MWPILLDMTKEESMQHLRCLEIDAFSGLVAALRAQGTLSTAKLNLLKETSNMLHISQERHKAEIRRVVNDERLNTIAYHVNGERHCGQEWADEGQRLIPLMPRVAPQTAYAAIADEAADATSKLNKNLPSPASTERKRVAPPPPAPAPSSSAAGGERKRKQSFSVENCALAQHLMAPPKISKIQQIYRQRSKARLKEQLGRLRQQEREKDAPPSRTHHANAALPPHSSPKRKINILQNITTAPAKPPADEKHPRVQQQDKAAAPSRGAPTCADRHPSAIPSTATTTTTTTTNASKTITTADGQKLIVVSTHVTPSNHTASPSILQRTLTTLPLKSVAVTPRFRVVPKATGYAAPSKSASATGVARHRALGVRPPANHKNASLSPPSVQVLNAKTGQLFPLAAVKSRAEVARPQRANNCVAGSGEAVKEDRIARVVENHASERISRDVVEKDGKRVSVVVEVNGVEKDDVNSNRNDIAGMKHDNGIEGVLRKAGASPRVEEEDIVCVEEATNAVEGNGFDEDVPESVEEEETEVVFEDKVDLDSSVYIYGDDDDASEEVIIDTIGAPPMEVLNAVHALDESLPNVKNVRS